MFQNSEVRLWLVKEKGERPEEGRQQGEERKDRCQEGGVNTLPLHIYR